jgi:hypothetical protein
MSVWHVVFTTDSLTYTIAKALTHGGHDLFVRTVDPHRDERPREGIQKRLSDTPGVRLVAADDSGRAERIDRLIVQSFPRSEVVLARIAALAERAPAITLVTAGDRSRSLKNALALQWLEMRRLGRNLRKVDRIVYKDGYYRFDLLRNVAPRQVLGFDVHSQFLHDPALYRAMHARDWVPQGRRSIRANFLGSRDPAPRTRILDAVRPLFRTADGSRPFAADGKTMFWHEYSDAVPTGLPPEQFVRLLTDSDFTLCPRGYSLVTHHPIEALLRGSIPVLASNELDLYGIELADGVNCIAVRDGDWAQAVRRLESMSETEIVDIRRRIEAMFERDLAYDRMTRRIRCCIGVAEGI